LHETIPFRAAAECKKYKPAVCKLSGPIKRGRKSAVAARRTATVCYSSACITHRLRDQIRCTAHGILLGLSRRTRRRVRGAGLMQATSFAASSSKSPLHRARVKRLDTWLVGMQGNKADTARCTNTGPSTHASLYGHEGRPRGLAKRSCAVIRRRLSRRQRSPSA